MESVIEMIPPTISVLSLGTHAITHKGRQTLVEHIMCDGIAHIGVDIGVTTSSHFGYTIAKSLIYIAGFKVVAIYITGKTIMYIWTKIEIDIQPYMKHVVICHVCSNKMSQRNINMGWAVCYNTKCFRSSVICTIKGCLKEASKLLNNYPEQLSISQPRCKLHSLNNNGSIKLRTQRSQVQSHWDSRTQQSQVNAMRTQQSQVQSHWDSRTQRSQVQSHWDSRTQRSQVNAMRTQRSQVNAVLLQDQPYSILKGSNVIQPKHFATDNQTGPITLPMMVVGTVTMGVTIAGGPLIIPVVWGVVGILRIATYIISN